MRDFKLCLAAVLTVVLADAATVAQGQPQKPRVKNITEGVSCNDIHWAVVEMIDADGMTVVQKLKDNKTLTHKLVPVDHLKGGKVLDNMTANDSYLWSDVKKGDTLSLQVLKDDADGLTYCLAISIRRRPGGKLPESQKPEKDERYAADKVLNDITNGEDVSDEELLKTWPEWVHPETRAVTPGGLWKTGWMAPYHDKLEANRKRIAEEKAKKEKELKAKPTEKKGDKE
jgi:hypothetical protein